MPIKTQRSSGCSKMISFEYISLCLALSFFLHYGNVHSCFSSAAMTTPGFSPYAGSSCDWRDFRSASCTVKDGAGTSTVGKRLFRRQPRRPLWNVSVQYRMRCTACHAVIFCYARRMEGLERLVAVRIHISEGGIVCSILQVCTICEVFILYQAQRIIITCIMYIMH